MDDLPVASSNIEENHLTVDYFKPLTPGPNDFGFDYFFGIPVRTWIPRVC